jgi:hypothetical protein
MAATAVNVVRGDMGAFYVSIDDVTFDSSYPSGGYSMAGIIPLQTILGMDEVGGNAGAIGYYPFWNTATNKLLFAVGAAFTPTASPTVTVIGSQSSANTNLQIYPNSGNAGVLGSTASIGTQVIAGSTFGLTLGLQSSGQISFAQLTTGTNLSTVTERMLSIGY